MVRTCTQCGAPIMERAEEIDRLAAIYEEHKRDLLYLDWVRARVDDLQFDPRVGPHGANWCRVCQEMNFIISGKKYWLIVQAQWLEFKRGEI